MEICNHKECTGCYACLSVCPHSCISMQEDDYGELHPVVDEDKCVHCNACIKTCPCNNQKEVSLPRKCYASWITDKEKRCICASGGIGTILGEYVIRYKQGVVFGTAYDEVFIPRITYTEAIEGLKKFKGSKYVQSIVGKNTYKDVRDFLKKGRFVLFVGTPCQIAGLKSFLRKDYENLITVDLICHGVSPTKYFKEEISHIVEENGIKDLCDIRFRGNDNINSFLSFWDTIKGKSNNFALTLWHLVEGKKMRCYRRSALTDYYLRGFLLGVTLRENCYTCRYATPERISDITIGDFIGLGKKKKFPYSPRNVSSVTLNTAKSECFYKEVSEKMLELINIERDYTERLEYKPSLIEPYARHPLSSQFKNAYLEGGYLFASRKVLESEIKTGVKKEKMQEARRILLFPLIALWKAYNIIKFK